MKKAWIVCGLEGLLPPNVDKESTVSRCTGIGVMGGVAAMLWFFVQYAQCRDRLYTYSSVLQKEVLRAGAKIEPFSHFAGGAGWLMAFFVFMILVLMATRYASFSQGSRSIYLMHRLPDGRRVMAGYLLRGPVWCLVRCAVICGALVGVYYLMWRFVTPAQCLPI